VPPGIAVNGRFHGRIREGMVTGCCATGSLEIDYCTISAETVALNKLMRNRLYSWLFFPADACLMKTPPEPGSMSRKIKKIAAVPPGYFINTVTEEKTPVVGTDHCLFLWKKLSVQKYCFHICKITPCGSCEASSSIP